MRGSFVSIALALVAGISVGVLIGLAVGAHGGTTLLVASVGVVGAVVATFSGWTLTEYSNRRHERVETVIRDRARYAQHSDELNDHVFRPCSGAWLWQRGVQYPADPSPPRGIQVNWRNSSTPIAGLPNWDLGLSHMLADPLLAEAWKRASDSTLGYLRLLDLADSSLRTRLDSLVREEYGPEMFLRRSLMDSDRPAWCDTPALAYLIVSRRAGGSYGPFYRQQTPPEARGDPRPDIMGDIYAGGGSSWSLRGRNSLESDPSRLQGIFDRVWNDSTLMALVDSAVGAWKEATALLGVFVQAVRRYSNRIATAHTFAGRCDVCEGYLLE
jgi:hypothetical protein